jgi:transcriptional regulator
MMRDNGYKGEEIAAELGISNSRVSNLITRAHEIAKAYKEKQDS